MDIVEVKYFDGQVTAFQPRSGYRAGTDAVLLAASLSGKAGTHFLELGAGSGAVSLMAAHHHPDCQFQGLENNQDMLALARKNTTAHHNIEVGEGSVTEVPQSWHLKFDQVFANPPYFDEKKAVRMSEEKAPSFVNTEMTSLADWISAMLITLKPRGTGTLIYRADKMEKVLVALAGKAGRLRILPVHSFRDEPAKRVIIQFRKGVKSESALLCPLVLHDRDRPEKFAKEASEIIAGIRKIKR